MTPPSQPIDACSYDYLSEMRMQFAISSMFVAVPEHEMIRREAAAIRNVTLNYWRPWEGSPEHVAVMQRKWSRYDTRFAAEMWSRRWFKAIGRLMWLEVKAIWFELVHPERVRHLPRHRPTIITGLTA